MRRFPRARAGTPPSVGANEVARSGETARVTVGRISAEVEKAAVLNGEAQDCGGRARPDACYQASGAHVGVAPR
jgi:hypothetical protein